MIDISSVSGDLVLLDTQTARAGNILSVQEGSLIYAPTLGIDLKYFLSPDFRFQNSSFKSYLIQTLANYSINVASVGETMASLFQKYTFNLSADENENSLVSR